MADMWGLWSGAFPRADEREIWDWAATEGELPLVYAVTGKLDIETCPMIKEPLRALRNPAIRNVVCMCGVQCLKTLIGELWLLWSIVNDPGPTQWLHPDNVEAREHALERFLPLIEKFPAVHRFYTSNRFDKQTSFIRFRHIFLRMEGAYELGNLQRKSIKNQMRSEIWQVDKWKPGRLKEADSRLTQYVHNSKTYTESQPGWDKVYCEDDMHAAYDAGNQNQIHFACLSCGKLQPFHWDFQRTDGTKAGLRWEVSERTRRPDGQWRWGELAQTVRYECIHCGHIHIDEPITRRRMTASLQHVPQNPDSDPATVSFNWGQLAMANLSWFETRLGGVKNYLLAKAAAENGNDGPLRDFVMKVLAIPYDPSKHGASPTMETIELAGEKEPRPGQPIEHDGIKFDNRLMSVDVQADHFWLLVEAWSAKGDSLTLHFEKVFSWDEVAERQQHFVVADQDVSIDISHRTQQVKTQCARHGHLIQVGQRKAWVCWRAMRGSDQPHFIWVPRAGRDRGKRIQLPYTWPPEVGDPCFGMPLNHPNRKEFAGKRCQIVTWSNPTIKDIAIARRDGAVASRNLVMRGEWNAEFNRQMHSQRKVPTPAKYGGDRWKWVKFRDDHGLDCKCMCIVRAIQKQLLAPDASGSSDAPTDGEDGHAVT
jgi:hypothetical protein